MYALIGNALFIWFSIRVFNYYGLHISYKRRTLADMALYNNVAHISTVRITKRVEPNDTQNPSTPLDLSKYTLGLDGTTLVDRIQDDTTSPSSNTGISPSSNTGISPSSNTGISRFFSKWVRGASSITDSSITDSSITDSSITDSSITDSSITDSSNCVTCDTKSALELSQYDALKNAIEDCVKQKENIIRLSTYAPMHNISDYITDISNCKIHDSIYKTAHQFTNYNTNPYKIKFICNNDALLVWKQFGYSFLQLIGVSKLIEILTQRFMNYIGFKHLDKFDYNGTRLWTYFVPDTEPIVFFNEPGIGFRLAHWGHYFKSLGRTVHIFGLSLNYNSTPVLDKSARRTPTVLLGFYKENLYSLSQDIIVHSSRAIDAEEYINGIIDKKYFLTVSGVVGFKFKESHWDKLY
jgi:hypothetical protein